MSRIPVTWLLIDVHHLAHRMFHAIGPLSNSKGDRTEVVFGILKSVLDYKQWHQAQRVIFCFDQGYEKRLEIYPEYKWKRRVDGQYTEEETEAYQAFRTQIFRLRTQYLKALGFKNVFSAKGYEADDVIASVCQSLHKEDTAIIVAADKDLYQLIRRNVIVWNPQTRDPLNLKAFKQKFGIHPKQWPLVKAITGCSTDCVEGIKGVGEVTAIRYIRQELMESSNAYKTIKQHEEMIERNLKLVTLPFEGTPTFKIKEDRMQRESWDRLIDIFEMPSLRKSLSWPGE